MNSHLTTILFALGMPEIILILVTLPLYFLPSIIGRKKENYKMILLLNIFLGWTLLGWIGAIIWASIDKKK